MADPGRAYLYEEAALKRMQPEASTSLPRAHRRSTSIDRTEGRKPIKLQANGGFDRWDRALGNLEDAKLTVGQLGEAISQAVYLDDDAYTQLEPVMKYAKVIQTQHKRITELEAEVDDLRTRLASSEAARKQAETRVTELNDELENNQTVFKLHYSELLAKEEEITKYKAIISGLS